MRVALVHDWLITWRGGEKVLLAMARRFPDAAIHTLLHDPADMPAELEAHPIHASALDRLPFAKRNHRWLLPAFPAAVQTLDVGDVDLVLSSSHCVAKAVRIPQGTRHLAYVHAPLRYMWDRYDDYFGPGRAGLGARVAARLSRPFLRAFDVATTPRVDAFLANSRHVARQIAERYHRHAAVLHPPVELARFSEGPLGSGEGGYFLCLGALAPYKRVDLAIEAFGRLGLPLWIAGSGQASRSWLASLPPNVRVLGQVRDDEVPGLLRGARALIFPGVEDFGLTPVETMAAGRPVIAYAAGGALETVTPETGLFFAEQTAAALEDAVRRFDAFERGFSPAAARAWAQRFDEASFVRGLDAAIARVMGAATAAPG